MAKLPGVLDLGGVPQAPETRPVGSYDTTPFARGGQALAQGELAVGQGISRFGAGVGDLAIDRNRWEYAQAHAGQAADLVNLHANMENDRTYMDDSGQTMPVRYAAQAKEINQRWAGTISDPNMRERFNFETQPQVQGTIAKASVHGRALWNNQAVADEEGQFNSVTDKAVTSTDDSTKTIALDSINSRIDGLVTSGALTPEQGLGKKARVGQFATADLLAATNSNDPQRIKDAVARASDPNNHLYDFIDPALRQRLIAEGQRFLDGHVGQQKGAAALSASRGGTFSPSAASGISDVASRYGIDPGTLTRAVQIESGGNPTARTGSYKGLLQLSDSEFNQYKPRPDASIWNPADNLEAGAAKMRAEGDQFAHNFGRQPTGFDAYMIHQQGLAGYSSHLANPNAPAWQNMAATAEGQQKGAGWAKAAIWGNIPTQYKAGFDNVDNVTSRDFVEMWRQRWGKGSGAASAFTGAAQQGGVQNAASPVANLGGAIRADAYQRIIDDPSMNDAQREHAFRTIDQQIKAQDIADNETTKAQKDASDAAAGDYVTKMWDALHTPNPDYVALAGQINHDPRLDWRTKQALMEHVKKVSGEEQALGFGPGYLAARHGLFSAPGDPGHVEFSDLVNRDDITTAGLRDLHERLSVTKSDVDRQAVERRVNFFLTDAKNRLSFEQDMGPIKLRDPKGESIFNSEFAPSFVKQASALAEDAQKTGDSSKLDAFLSKENVDKMIRSYRDPKEMARDRVAAAGEAGAEGGASPNEPLPPPPEGIKPEAWTQIVNSPPTTATGKPWPKAAWAGAVDLLRSDPSPEAKAQFDAKFGKSGMTADKVLQGLSAPPAEQGPGLVSRVTGAVSSFIEREREKQRAFDAESAARIPPASRGAPALPSPRGGGGPSRIPPLQ